MATDNIFSGLKVVDLASFIAGPGAATILSDFGAEVIKIEPPGVGDPYRLVYKMPPQPSSTENYAWHLDNRNKRGMALDLKSPQAKEILKRLVKWADVLVINFPPPVRQRLKLTYEDIASWNPRLIYADVSGYGDDGPDANLPGFDITAYWARSGLLALTRDAGAPPTLPPSGSGDHATAVGLYAAIVTALYRRERTGKGSHVTTSLVAEGAWSCSMYIQAGLCGANFYPLHDRLNPPNPIINVYRTSDDHWFLIVLQAKDWPALAHAIGRPDLVVGRAVCRWKSAWGACIRINRNTRPGLCLRSLWPTGARYSTRTTLPTASCGILRRPSLTRNCSPMTSSCLWKARVTV